MINRVILVGRLTKDATLKKTNSNKSVTSFTVACDRKNKVEGQPTADFINCICWNRVAENVAQYTHKGSLVGVEGRIQTRNYDDQNGNKVFVTEVLADSVQFLEPKGSGQQPQQQTYSQVQPQEQINTTPYVPPVMPSVPYVQQNYSEPQFNNYDRYQSSFNAYGNERDFSVNLNSDDLPF